MIESVISAGELKNYHTRKIFVFLRGPTIWKVMPRNVWNDIVSWQTIRLDNSTKYLPHASMTITSKREELKAWELKNYHTRKIFVFLRGPRIWKVMPRNVWNDIVSWQTRRLDNYKVSAPCIDDHHFKEGRIESGRTEKLPYSENIRISSWS